MRLFIFRRDLRFEDNNGLRIALKNKITPIFIFNPLQVGRKNSYRSLRAIDFMVERLLNLKISCFYGSDFEVLNSIAKKYKITDIHTNMDYTPFAIKRDEMLKTYCEKNGISFFLHEDYLLAPIGTYTRKENQSYIVFTPFFKKVIDHDFKPRYYKINNINKRKIKTAFSVDPVEFHSQSSRINKIDKRVYIMNKMKKYTGGLSPYIKFGCVSIRECWILKNIRRKLIWREFYYYIGYYNQHVLCENFRNIHNIKWRWNADKFAEWVSGNTGVTCIDEAMQELNETGFINNRKRLLCSNYLCMTLKIHWKHGEKYFATQLVDYDPYVNNGNWQWNAGTGSNTRPLSQQKIKFK